MNEEGIEVGDFPLLAVVGWEGVVVGVCFIEGGGEAAKEGGHGEVDATMAEVYGGVDEYRLFVGIAEEVTAPQVAVEEGGWFGWKYVGEGLVEALELQVGFVVEEAVLCRQLYLGFEAAVDEKVDPVGGGCVVLWKGAHIVVLVEAEQGLGDLVETGEGFAEGVPEAGGAGSLVDPFQDEGLGIVDLRAGHGGGDAEQLLLAEEGETVVLFCK